MIRLATAADVKTISDVIRLASEPNKSHDYSDSGWLFCLEYICPELTLKRMESGRYFSLVFVESEKILGVITIKDYAKIDQLFVHPDHWHKGIATALWTRARMLCEASGGNGCFSVRSSLSAISLYQKFGFHPSGERRQENGCRYTPMRLD